ncbi:MAG: DUF4190 domain-containing protein [Ruminococcus sp.]|nr:DUF4190 domain-containing protein [Ruminococcus sp.]MDE6788731.1 DUF4190 domain-containing protein [Ruminococcus sp.]
MDDFNSNNNNDGGVNLFKSPEPNDRQGESNAQQSPQNQNFGQQNFGGQPNPNPNPIQPNQFSGQNMGGYNPNPNFNQNANGGKGLSIAAMVCGIVSILGFCCCTPIGILCGLAGVILGIVSKTKKMDGSGMALAGIITGAIGIVGSIIAMIIGASMNADFFEQLQDAMDSVAIFFMFI